MYSKTANLYAVILSLVCGLPAMAGPLFPCLKAASSRSGSYLVVSEAQAEAKPDDRQITLRIYPKETYFNAKDAMSAPAAFWTNRLGWSVILDTRNLDFSPACPVPLITDYGEFLVLLQPGPIPSIAGAVLQIYRKRDHIGDLRREGPDHGVLVKSISLKELWRPGGPDTIPQGWMDSSPQWFAAGGFDFSPNNRRLTCQTPKGVLVYIELADGSVR